MIYEIDCKECEGSGCLGDGSYKCDSCKEGHCNDTGLQSPCPHCKGSGGFNLAREKPCDNCPAYEGLPEPRDYGCPVDGGQCDVWIPLTVDEVEELFDTVIPDGPDWFGLLMKGRLQVNYKGQPVKLMPREG